MIGIDVSNNNPITDILDVLDYVDFVIMKATEGEYFIDNQTEVLAKTIKGKPLGYYHFCANRGTKTSILSEADFFLKQLEKIGYDGNTILALDWERGDLSKTDFAMEFIRKVEEASGNDVLLYSSSSVITSYFMDEVRAGLKTWIASWGNNEPYSIPDGEYNYSKWVEFSSKYNAVIHQFTSEGKREGFTRYTLDVNYSPQIPLKKKIEDKEIISEDMKWCIERGIIKGFGNGIYKPTQAVTRNELATVIRRLNNLWGGN